VLDAALALRRSGARNRGMRRAHEWRTTAQTPGAPYTVKVSNVTDLSGNVVASGSTANFTALNPPDITNRVPEAADYMLVHTLLLPVANPNWNALPVPDAIDQRAFISKPLDRIGYFIELDSKWVWVSANAFTADINRVGVPTSQSGALFQMPLTSMNVAASAGSGVVTGSGLSGGNIEFWPTDYAPACCRLEDRQKSRRSKCCRSRGMSALCRVFTQVARRGRLGIAAAEWSV